MGVVGKLFLILWAVCLLPWGSVEAVPLRAMASREENQSGKIKPMAHRVAVVSGPLRRLDELLGQPRRPLAQGKLQPLARMMGNAPMLANQVGAPRLMPMVTRLETAGGPVRPVLMRLAVMTGHPQVATTGVKLVPLRQLLAKAPSVAAVGGSTTVASTLVLGDGGAAGGSGVGGVAGGVGGATMVNVPTMNPATGEELMLQMLLNQQLWLELFTAYQDTNGNLLVPLGGLMEALGFPVKVDAAAGTAEGWTVREERTFKLDTRKGEVTLSGKVSPLAAGAVQALGNDLLVRAAEVEAWFPVKLRLAFNELTLYVETTEELPMQAQKLRQKKWAQETRNAELTTLPTGPKTVLPYQLLSAPNLGVGASMGLARGADGKITNGGSVNVQAQGNMLYMDSFLSAGLTRDARNGLKVSAGSLKLSRQSVAGDLLGPLAATKVELGDVYLPGVPLIPSGGTGRGALVTNAPSGFVADASQFQLTGLGPVGWDMEVYQDGNLVAFTTLGTDGQYAFSNIRLRVGANNFRLVFYGPQGERQERNEQFFLGAGMVKPGELVYRAGVVENGATALGMLNATKTQTTSQLASVVQGYYGLTPNLSLAVGAMRGKVKDDLVGQGGSVGLRGNVGDIFAQFDTATLGQDWAQSMNVQTQIISGTDVGAFYRNVLRELVTDGGVTSSRGLNVAQRLDVGLGRPLQLGFNIRQDTYEDKRRAWLVGTDQSFVLGRVSLRNTIDYALNQSADGEGIGQWQGGQLSFATNVGSQALRGEINYRVDGGQNWLDSVSLGGGRQLDTDLNLDLSGQYQVASGDFSLSGGLQRQLPKVSVGLTGSVNSERAVQVGLNMSSQLVPTDDGYKLAERSEGGGYGRADIRVFVDDNNNQHYDVGEDLLDEVRVQNLRTGRTTMTDTKGKARIYDLIPYVESPLQLDEASLPDINLKAMQGVQVLVANQGYGGVVDFPVQRFGMVTGWVKGKVPAGMELWLLTGPTGYTVAKTRVEYDGFFVLEGVPLGSYEIRANPLTLPAGRHVTAPAVVLTKARSEMNDVVVWVK